MNYNLKKILILAVTSVAILISVSILFSGSYFHSGLSFNGTFKIYSYLTPKIIHLSTISMLLSVMSFFVLPNVFSQKKVKTYSRQEQGTLLIFLAIFESLTLFHVLFWEVQEHYVYIMLPFLLATGAILTSKIFSPKNSVLLLDKERNYNA